jgi:hypothetical protein
MAEIKSFCGRSYIIAKLCAYCGRRLSPFGGRIDSKVKDYIVPLSKGGQDIPENAVASCKECQVIKGEYLNFALLPLATHRFRLIDDVRCYIKEVKQVIGVRSSVMDIPR